ncbi:MAG TPA: hypothetical protein DCZ92_04715 [Elusimicrobia bacterium]|nr:hypothetical protein [Elusimicrobiota bacterium]
MYYRVLQCRQLCLTGDKVRKDVYLLYLRSQLTITLYYLASNYPKLESFEIATLEARSGGLPLPVAEAQRMSDFAAKLDRTSGNTGAGK